MKLQEGKRYAIIENGRIAYILDSSICKEVDERSLQVVELPAENEYIIEGCEYKNGAFVPITIDEAKELQLHYINNRFENEVAELQGEYVPKEEVLSYALQLAEAKDFLKNGNASDVPFIAALNAQRGGDLRELAQKIVEKNTAYTTKLATIMGYRQNLKSRLQACSSLDEIRNITYHSPFGFE